MKAIILAAGEGTRLKPFTNKHPKCLIPLKGKSLFDHQVDIMKECNLDVIAVTGYKAEQITRKDVKFYINKDYNTTNMVMTLWCAEKELTDSVIISYGDIIYSKNVLQSLIDSPHDISVIVDMDWEQYWKERFINPLNDAEALKMDADFKISVIGQKAHTLNDVEAGYIGLIKLQGKGIKTFKKSFLHAKEESLKINGKPWGIAKPIEKAYMTDMLQGLIYENNDIFAIPVQGEWLEIDSMKDYEVAKKLFTKRIKIKCEQSL